MPEKSHRVQSSLWPVCVLLGGLLLSVTRAHAQVTADLVLEPWADGVYVESYDNLFFEDRGAVKDTTYDTHVFFWDSLARFRSNKDDHWSPSFGFRLLTLDTGIHFAPTDPRQKYLPSSTLNDLALAGHMPLYHTDDLHVSIIAGAGYSGNSPFDDPGALYGIGHFVVDKTLSDTDNLAVTLDYQGNNAFLPDIPLPGMAWRHHTDTLQLMLGYPTDSVVWKPAKKITLEARYSVPYTAFASASYELFSGFSLYGSFNNTCEGFTLSNSDSSDRAFLTMRRAEAGVRYIYGKAIDATLGLGYAFDQSISHGFDVTDLHTVDELTDRPFLSIVIRGVY